jgi:glycine/D-amino acid oxidase-like deaminating enzyme
MPTHTSWQAAAERTDVLVVGGGVQGCATAYYLARRGVDVLLVERGVLNREASGANAGSLHIQIPAFHFRTQYLDRPRDPEREALFLATNQLYLEAARSWSGLERELDADLGVRIGGGLMVAETEAELEVLRLKVAYEQSIGLETRLVAPTEIARLAPALSPELVGAAYCAIEGFANPLLAGPAYMHRARALGARLRLGCRVTQIEVDSGSSGAFQVTTSIGPIVADRLVVAAGAQTREVANMVGFDLPILPHPLQVVSTEPVRTPLVSQLIQHAGNRHLSMRQTQYGTFVIGGGWPAIDQPGSDRLGVAMRSIRGNAQVAIDVVPLLREVRLTRAWAGMTTSAGRRNRVGFIGRFAGLRNLYLMVSAGWGFTLSPVLGRAMAELVVDGASRLEIGPFDVAAAVAAM